MPEPPSTPVSVAVLGASGYTAAELIRLLLRHPGARLVAATSRQDAGKPLHAVHPQFFGRTDLTLEDLPAAELARRAQVVFCCTPHGAAMAAVPDLLSAGARVIDLSADYRLSDPGVYEQWYGLVHTDPTRLGETVYGLPELFADAIPSADLVANPGCYTSTAILALAPLIAGGLVEPAGILIDAKSGVSGAGRSLKLGSLFAECNENFTAYGVGTHRHQPEIEQILSQHSGKPVDAIFTPHLVPMDRGIFATIYGTPTPEATPERMLAALREFYAGKPFVRVTDAIPQTKAVSDTNFCDVTVRLVKGRALVFAALDNLIKGAAGVAVQNFNLMTGCDETTALL